MTQPCAVFSLLGAGGQGEKVVMKAGPQAAVVHASEASRGSCWDGWWSPGDQPQSPGCTFRGLCLLDSGLTNAGPDPESELQL